MENKIKMPGHLYKLTFLIGLGFFTTGLMNPLYDSFVPIFLNRFIESKGSIGLIMTLDNVFAIFCIPIISAISDRTKTPIGRRMPFIITLIPISAILFMFLPIAAFHSLIAIIILLFFYNFFRQTAYGPTVALMPDVIPGDYRSEANGVINTMGGIAAIVGTIGLSKLMDVYVDFPIIGRRKDILPFIIAGFLILIAILVLYLTVKEKQENVKKEDEKERIPITKSLRIIFSDSDKSALFILIAIFLWFLAYQGVLPYVAMFAKEIIGVSTGTAGISPGMVAIAYALFAIPSGMLAHKYGRKKIIRTSLFGITIISIVIYMLGQLLFPTITTVLPKLVLFWGLLFLFGIFWGSIVTNSFPMLWQMAHYGNIGVYTGLYYTFSQSAAIIAPPINGVLIDFFGFPAIFLFAGFCMFGAFIIINFVKKGEASNIENGVQEI